MSILTPSNLHESDIHNQNQGGSPRTSSECSRPTRKSRGPANYRKTKKVSSFIMYTQFYQNRQEKKKKDALVGSNT